MTDFTVLAVGLALAILVVVLLLLRMIVTLPPNQQGVVILLGSYLATIPPGFNMVSPVARVVRVDLGSQRLPVPPFGLSTTADTPRLTAEVPFYVTDAAKSVFGVTDLKRGLVDGVHQAAVDVVGDPLAGAVGPTDFQPSAALTERLRDNAARWGVSIEVVVVQRA